MSKKILKAGAERSGAKRVGVAFHPLLLILAKSGPVLAPVLIGGGACSGFPVLCLDLAGLRCQVLWISAIFATRARNCKRMFREGKSNSSHRIPLPATGPHRPAGCCGGQKKTVPSTTARRGISGATSASQAPPLQEGVVPLEPSAKKHLPQRGSVVRFRRRIKHAGVTCHCPNLVESVL
ncbi:hypothetical protein B0I37DRAFT_55838 [Chaetomium sp. MPI-CAGE-AT-0009]|nr:hypothetical protein B0I37DRAFT_55838 [Chaetomium sp. MPI-CAGE-AT-0009]